MAHSREKLSRSGTESGRFWLSLGVYTQIMLVRKRCDLTLSIHEVPVSNVSLELLI